MSRMRLIVLALVIAATSSSCAPLERLVFVQEPLPLPDRPELPKIPADELMAISDEAFESLVKRDVLQAQHILRLEAIIKTTHK